MGLFGRTMRPQNLRVAAGREDFSDEVLATGCQAHDIMLGGFRWDNGFPNPVTPAGFAVSRIAPSAEPDKIHISVPNVAGALWEIWYISRKPPEELVDPNQYQRPYSSGFYPKGTWQTQVIPGAGAFTSIACPGLEVGDVVHSVVGYQTDTIALTEIGGTWTPQIVGSELIGFAEDSTGWNLRVCWASRDDRSALRPPSPVGNGSQTTWNGLPTPATIRFFTGLLPTGAGVPIIMPDMTAKSFILSANQFTTTGVVADVVEELQVGPGGVLTLSGLGGLGQILQAVYVI